MAEASTRASLQRGQRSTSLVGPDDAIKVGGRYEPKDGRIAATETFISQPGESDEVRRRTQAENLAWYEAICADMFT